MNPASKYAWGIAPPYWLNNDSINTRTCCASQTRTGIINFECFPVSVNRRRDWMWLAMATVTKDTHSGLETKRASDILEEMAECPLSLLWPFQGPRVCWQRTLSVGMVTTSNNYEWEIFIKAKSARECTPPFSPSNAPHPYPGHWIIYGLVNIKFIQFISSAVMAIFFF